jgi:hypothetical protein
MKHQPKEIIVYQTKRMTVVRLAFRDFVLYVDGELISFHDTQDKAEHTGAVILEEQAHDIAIRVAHAV